MWLPSHKDTGIGALATPEAKGSVKHVLENQASQQNAKKQKQYINFSDTDRAKIHWYAAEYGMLLLNVMYIDIHDYTMHVLVKIKGGAKTGTAHLQK